MDKIEIKTHPKRQKGILNNGKRKNRQEDTATMWAYRQPARVSKYIEQQLMELQREICKSTIIMGGSITVSFENDRSSREKQAENRMT